MFNKIQNLKERKIIEIGTLEFVASNQFLFSISLHSKWSDLSRVYHGASNTLNMKALLGFLQELVFQSRKQLITCQTKQNGGNHLYPEETLVYSSKKNDYMM